VFIIEHFDVEVFLANYWQKKPCLIKQFQPNFADPIDENDLAGLAQEDEVDSRIVSNENGVWQVSQGPFTEFELACKGSWSLLVQGVDRYIPEVDSLSQLVSFIPMNTTYSFYKGRAKDVGK
jgi:50S ribosomal protein L16 3-hydroxylase